MLRILFVCWLVLQFTFTAIARSLPEPTSEILEQDIKFLIVMIEGRLQGESTKGAGIIFGVEGDSLLIVTADHVVRRGTDEAQEIRLDFRSGGRISAALMPQHDTELDLAVLRVNGLSKLGLNLESLPFDRLGSPTSLRRGGEIYMIGYPGGKKWWINATPGRFAEQDGNWIRFESQFITSGYSGGALLDEHRNLVGMVRSDDPPNGEALSITTIIRKLREWRLPLSLGEVDSSPIDFSMVSIFADRVCGITRLGTAYCWGRIGTSPPIGDGVLGRQYDWVFSPHPVRVRGNFIFKSISVGWGYTCGVTTEGVGYCWGNNDGGGLGNGSRVPSLYPSPVSGDLTFQSISAGGDRTCGLTNDSKIYCWGNQRIQPELMQGGTGFRSVNAVLPAYGVSLKGIPFILNFLSPAEPQNIVFDRESRGCGITKDRAAHCWNDGGFRKIPTPERVAFQSIDGEFDFWCGIETNGNIRCNKMPDDEKRTQSLVMRAPSGGAFRSVSVGGVVCGITNDSALYCWGVLSGYDDAKGRQDIKVYGATPALITRR